MPLQEFWNDEPDLLWAYRNAYLNKEKLRIQEKNETINFQAWLQGYYNNVAIVSALSKNVNYLSQPISLNERSKSKKEKNLEIAQRIKERALKGRKILERQKGANKE